NVNLFHARVKDGLARIGDLTLPAPEHGDQREGEGFAYVRPHEIEFVAEGQGLPATIELVSVVGPTVRLELRVENGEDLVHAEVPKEHFRRLGLMQGDTTWIRPLRSRVFLEAETLPGIER